MFLPARNSRRRESSRSRSSSRAFRRRCWFALNLFPALLLAAGPAGAQSFPTRTVRITMPHSAGVAPSIFMRLIAEKLSRLWGKQVVVENKPGASGFIAIESMKSAARDGHELLAVANSHMTINPSLYRRLPYDPQKDFEPLAMGRRAP